MNHTSFSLAKAGLVDPALASVDWRHSPLGAVEDWPPALRIAVSMLMSSSFPKCLCWGPDLTMIYNSAFVPILGGKHPCLGKSFRDIWAEAWDEIGPIADKAMAGEATFIEDFPLVTERNGHPEKAYFTFCYSPVRDEMGVVRGMLDTVVETTDKVKAQMQAELRNRELVHRTRNAYALVSALVGQTHRHSATLEEAQAKVQGRLSSLNRALDLLSVRGADTASISEIVEKALEPFRLDPQSFSISGPAAEASGDQATTLALALHELATNATKYGSLSTPEGRVAIEWTVEHVAGAKTLQFDWIESDGPIVPDSATQGFGSFLVRQALPTEFSGIVTLDFPPSGARMRLTGTLSDRA